MKVLVLGIGNVMFADEGVGVHFINFIKNNFSFTSSIHSIDFIDGGTMANLLIPIIAEYDFVVIVDCIDADDSEIGDVYYFDFEAMPKSISWSGSAHEIEMLQTLQMMDLTGDRPITKILAVVPKRIKPTSFSLSDEIKKSLPIMQKSLFDELSNLGFAIQQTKNLSIEEIINLWQKEQF
nr:HyaD/HybD family hydrogenase maturation endopeptidase [Campylobacter sp.]